MAQVSVLLTLVLLTTVTVSTGNPLQDSDNERVAAIRERLKAMLQNLNELNSAGDNAGKEEDKAELAKRQLGYLVNPEGRRPEAAKRAEQVESPKQDQNWLDSAVESARTANPFDGQNSPTADEREKAYNILRWIIKHSPKAKSAINKEVGETSSELAREHGVLEGANWMYNLMRKNLNNGKSALDEELEAPVEYTREKSQTSFWNPQNLPSKSQHKQAGGDGIDEDSLKLALSYLQSKLQKRDHDIPFPLTADHQ